MKELHAARRALVKDRTAAFNREKLLRSGLLKRQATQRLRQIDHQIAAIDAALAALRDADFDLKLRFDILASISGHRCDNRLRDAYRDARARRNRE